MKQISEYISASKGRLGLGVLFLRSRPYASGAVGAVILVVLWLVFSGNGASMQTFVVTRGDFLQQVSVSGKVKAAHDVNLGFSQGGRVTRVYAKVGDQAYAGAVLAEVENGDLHASVKREEAELASLIAGTRMEEIAVKESEVESREAAYTQARQSLVDKIRDAYRSADAAIRNDADQFFDTPRTNPQLTVIINDAQLELSLEAKRLAIESALASWKSATEALSLESDLTSAAKDAQANLTLAAGLLSEANTALNKASPTGSVSESDINGYVADVAAARTSINTAVSAVTAAVTAQLDTAAALATARKNLVLSQSGATKANIDAQEAEVENARAQLRKTLILAPFAGTVSAVLVEAGEVAQANTTVISLLAAGTLEIESFIPEIHVALVNVGDAALVTLDAYGDDVPFTAAVVSIDPAETVRDGVSTYRAILRFSALDERVRSGMTANVLITTEEKEGVFAIPQGIVRREGGKTFVEVLEGKETILRGIVIGSVSSLGDVEVVSGLSEGDIVLVSP